MDTTLSNRQPLSQVTRKKLNRWQHSADPADRLSTPYYQLQRQLVMEDYHNQVKEAAAEEDFIAMADAREIFFASLEVLRNDYAKDMQLLVEMQLTRLNVWNPFNWWPDPAGTGV